MIPLIILFLSCITAQRTEDSLQVTGRYNDTIKVDGYSSYKTHLGNIEELLADKIKESYKFALQFTNETPSVLFSHTTPEKLVFLQLLDSFDSKSSNLTNFLVQVGNSCTFPSGQSFRDWIAKNFDFPAERIYEIIKYVAITKPVLQEQISEQLFFLNVKYNIFQKAATAGDTEIIKWLLIHSTTSNANEVDLKTVEELWKNSKVEILDLLMKYGKINEKNIPAGVINERFKNDETFLHIASRSGYVNTINLLVTNLGANVSAEDVDGKSPLTKAVENDKYEAVETLVSNGADISSEPLLALAVKKGYTQTVQSLVNLGVSLNMKDRDGEAPFFWAVKNNNLKILKILGNISGPKKAVLNSTNDFGDTLMHVASSKGFIDSVKLLAELGVFNDFKNNLGETPLFKAVESGNLEVLNFLMESGADIKTRTNLGDTILHVAASLGNLEIIKLMLAKRFPINIKNNNGNTPLYKAAISGNCDLMKFLVGKGGDLNTNTNGMTMLHEAAAEGNEKAVICLIDIGIKVDVLGFWDATPLHLAVSKGRERIVQRLLERKANPNSKTKNLWTPLHRAVLRNNENIIKLLIDQGADVTNKNGAGETPYNLAVNNNQTKAAGVLRSKIKNLANT